MENSKLTAEGWDWSIYMHRPVNRTIDGKLYNSATADMVAHGFFRDGSEQDPLGRIQILYKTKRGDFFIFYESRWEDEIDCIEAVSEDDAHAFYESLILQAMNYDEAFGFKPEEA